jgi:hypothetical protein
MKSWKGFALPALALLIAGVVLVAQLGPSATAAIPSTSDVPSVAKSEAAQTETGPVTVTNWQETGFTGGGDGIHKVK